MINKNKKWSLHKLCKLIAKHEKILKDNSLKPFIFFVPGTGVVKLYAQNKIEAEKILKKSL